MDDIQIKNVNAGPLGRRYTVHCTPCGGVKLPGRFSDREQAEQTGSAHLNERHLARLTQRAIEV